MVPAAAESAVAALLLLVTCVTVGGALLTRTSARAHELAVRTALGAGRARLTRQLLTEGVVLSTSGAALGTAFAIAMQPLLRALLPESVPRVGSIAPSASLIGFAVVAAVITILVATVVPAWRGGRIDITKGLSIATARSSTAE